MEEPRKGFIFYKSFYDSIKEIEDDKTKAELYDAIMAYGIYGIEPELEGMAKALFVLVKPQIDANNNRLENAKKGGRKPKANQTETKTEPNQNQSETKLKPNANQTETEPEPKEKEKDKDKEKVKEKEKEIDGRTSAPRFRKPTREEVAEYCQERGNHVDVDRFMDYYDSNGWKVGKNPMKDWKATIRTWEKNGFDNPRGKPNTYGGSTERANAFDDLEEQLMNELNGGL